MKKTYLGLLQGRHISQLRGDAQVKTKEKGGYQHLHLAKCSHSFQTLNSNIFRLFTELGRFVRLGLHRVFRTVALA